MAGFVLFGLTYEKPISEVKQKAEKASPDQAARVSYTIIDEDIIDAPIKTQIEQHVLASGVPTEDGLRLQLQRLYDEAKARRGFRHHASPTNIFIYVYGSPEQASAKQGLWIGMVAKGFNNRSPSIDINKDRLAALSAPAKDRFNLSETKRRELFYKTVSAERRASREAMKRGGDLQQQANFEGMLLDEYKRKIAEAHGITVDQLIKLEVEGVKNGWPLPPYE